MVVVDPGDDGSPDQAVEGDELPRDEVESEGSEETARAGERLHPEFLCVHGGASCNMGLRTPDCSMPVAWRKGDCLAASSTGTAGARARLVSVWQEAPHGRARQGYKSCMWKGIGVRVIPRLVWGLRHVGLI